MTLEEALQKCEQAEMIRVQKRQEIDSLKVSLLDYDSAALGDAVKAYVVTMKGETMPSLADDATEAFGTIAQIVILELEC